MRASVHRQAAARIRPFPRLNRRGTWQVPHPLLFPALDVLSMARDAIRIVPDLQASLS